MTNPFVPTNEAEAVVTAPTAQATFSKTTVAKLRLTTQNLTDAKNSMIHDMSAQRLEPTAMLNKIMELQNVQTALDTVTASVIGSADMPAPFTDQEVHEMRDLKKEHNLTEHELAALYDTNQSKINRVLNYLAR